MKDGYACEVCGDGAALDCSGDPEWVTCPDCVAEAARDVTPLMTPRWLAEWQRENDRGQFPDRDPGA